MKTLKLISATTVALALAGIASADVIVVNLSGSTAFRSVAVNSEVAHLSNVGANLPSGVAQAAYDGSSLTGATWSIVYGYDANGNEIMYRNHWTGSAAGVYDLANGTLLTQLPTNTTLAATPAGQQTAAGAENGTTAASDMAFTDVQAADVSASVATSIGGSAFATTINSSGMTDVGTGLNKSKGCAANLFEWCVGKSSSFPSSWSSIGYNITQQNAATLLSQGYVSLAEVTGNSSDANTYLVFIGRNEDSGTRVSYIAESFGGGTPANVNAFGASIKQFMLYQDAIGYPTGPLTALGNSYPTISAGTTITGFQLWPRLQANPANTGWTVSTIPSMTWKTAGHSGYNGGGDVANILKTNNPVTLSGNFTNGYSGIPNTATAVYFVSYIGVSDTNGVVTAGGHACSYNGVPFTNAAVAAGQCSTWTFEHAYYLPGVGTDQKTAADGLVDTLTALPTSTLGASGLAIADLGTGLGRQQIAGGRLP